MGILDLIFPKFCVNCKRYGDYVCPNCFTYLSFDVANICAVCSRPSVDGSTHPGCITRYSIDGTFVGIDYNSIAKKLIYQFKYRPNLHTLDKFLSELLYEALIQKEFFMNLFENNENNFILVPIPLSSAKERSRGYNQADLLSKALSKRLGLRSANFLTRTRETKTQAGLSKIERRKNMENVFVINSAKKTNIASSYVFLVDDILTTGATFDSAARVLKKAGVKKVYGIALAKEK